MSKVKNLFYNIAKIKYPENQAGGTGSYQVSDLSVSANESMDVLRTENNENTLVFESKSYGCSYNAPYISNVDKVRDALSKIGFKLEIE